MTPEEAIEVVRKNFPFEASMNKEKRACLNTARIVLKYLKPPAKILDFGAGPCDKAAVLSVLGFECSACDDLKEHWHMIPGNREKILTFAHKFNIPYSITDDEMNLPFEKNEFDMLMMHHILEHLHDSPRNLVNDLLGFVKPEGYFLVSVPNAVHLEKCVRVALGRTNLPSFEYYYWYPGPWRGHIREYVRGDLVRLAEYLSLDILELHGCHHMLHAVPAFLRPVWVALTSVLTSRRDSWLLLAQKKPGWTPKRSLSQEELNTFFGRYSSYQYC